MQSLGGGLRLLQRQSSKIVHFTRNSGSSASNGVRSLSKCSYQSWAASMCYFPIAKTCSQTETLTCSSSVMLFKNPQAGLFRWAAVSPPFLGRYMTTVTQEPEEPRRVKFKRLDKTAKHVMQILDREAVQEVKAQRDMPEIKPGYIVQLRVEVPENKRRVSTLKGIVIAMRNAGLNSTFRIRRLVAGVGVESLYPLYSPNTKEIKVLSKMKTRRAKLYYLRNRTNMLKKQQ